MSALWNHEFLDPRTRLDMETRECSCGQVSQPDGRWHICDYHEGYDDALDRYPQDDALSPRPPRPSDDAATSCDWGGCDGEGVTWRWADDFGMWLPVCAEHRPSPTLADVLPTPSDEAITEYQAGLARIEAAERAARANGAVSDDQ